MGLFDKLIAKRNGNWCSACSIRIDESSRKLYAIPSMSVGHYADRKDADFYLQKLVPVAQKADIPVGMYACRVVESRCPRCGKRVVKVCPFLPVRDAEKKEFAHVYENGELDGLFNA